MKRITTLKAFALSLTMVLGMLLPMTTNAQSDGFFRGGSDNYDNRDSGMELGGSTAENPTPVGSGLLVLTIAGACYVAWKRKRSLNLLLASAMLFTFTQCKKKEIASVSNNGVHITLNAGYDNLKTSFEPATGAFVWTNGQTEYIYVGGSQHAACLGALSGTGNGTGSMTFSGTLTTTPNEGETLHFFYLGKGRNGSAVSTLDFSNQTGALDNVTNWHIAVGEGSYSDDNINYATTLEMKMAIAYFDVSGFKKADETAETVYLHGDEVYTTATVDYTTGTITGATKGYLNMGTATNGKYVALIPSVETATTLKFDSDSKTGSMTFNRGIQAKKYYSNEGAALAVTANNSMDEGALSGLYSVSATQKVRFSKGNLQYNTTTSEWSFMANQYNIVEQANQNVGTDYANWSVVSLFGWGTGNNPTCTSGNFSNFDEWGNNAIVNGGNTPNSGWRTPTSDEWHYLFTSSDRSNKRFLKATILGHKGVILFPDSYDGTELTGSYSYNTSGFQSVDNDDWVKMEAVGAAFLPAAGMRNGTNCTVVNGDVGKDGAYWSSTYQREVWFNKGDDLNDQFATGNLNWGQSVRLVRDVK